MGPIDIVTALLILVGCFYLLYRSLWKKRGTCCGCGETSCKAGKKDRFGCS